LRLEAVRRMIGAMVDDVLEQTLRNAGAAGVASAEDVRLLGRPLVGFSGDMAEDLGRLRHFLHQRMYRHYRVNRTRSQARRILAEMFGLFLTEPEVMPTEWFDRVQPLDETGRARVVCDYIAGMTDRFAIEEHRRLFNLETWN
jgi:dGTPase